MSQSGKRLYLYKLDFVEWYWYFAAFVPKGKWLQSQHVRVLPILAFCFYEGAYCEHFFTPLVWRRDNMRSFEKVSPLEVLVVFGHSVETLKERLEEKSNARF
jgi:hypothetical protein